MAELSTQNNTSPTFSHTEGSRRSMIDSPSWTITYGVTESLIKKFGVKTLAEVGVARGHHSAHLLEAISDLHVYSVDPWGYFSDEYNNMYNYHTLADDEKIYQQAVELLKPFGNRSTILRETSRRAAQEIKGQIDMVYLDGDHSYEGYKDDLNVWWRKVRAGGIFSGRDYGHPQHPGVAKAIDEFLANSKGLKFNLEAGKVWWIIKSPEAEIKILPDEKEQNFRLRPPLLSRLKRRIKRFFIIAPIKIKSFIRKIPGVKPIYSIFKKYIKK
jgi:hypothetical protein